MEVVTLVLVMLLLVVVSGFIVRVLPWHMPLPLVQIALGAVTASFVEFRVTLEPHIFFLLFLPPLLFLDGWRIPKVGLFRDKGTILELSLGLVLLTVVGMGFFIHWMIPAMPLAVAFALSAVVSPTDPVAVAAIGKRVPIPKRIMHILEGESLLNDASGLVCLRFAIAAALTGTFSLPSAAATFLWLAIGGVAVGTLFTLGVSMAKNWLARHYGEESGTQILISILIPFGAYIIAEHFHCSGILAAVAAGVTMSYVERTGQLMATTRVRRNAVWDAIQFAANGVIFVLLGEQLPALFEGAATVVRETGHHDEWWLVIYVGAITLGLAALRFIWVWVSVRFTMLRASWRGKNVQKKKLHWRIIAAMSVAGVRGAITLAGILTLPLLMSDGSVFPARDLAIFLAAGVIISSLIIASVALPPLLHGLELPEESHDAEEDLARAAAANAAIQAIEQTQHDMAEGRDDADMYAVAASRVMTYFRHQVTSSQEEEDRDHIRAMEVIEKKLHLAGMRASRNEIFRLSRLNQIEDDVMRKLVREIDLVESRYDV